MRKEGTTSKQVDSLNFLLTDQAHISFMPRTVIKSGDQVRALLIPYKDARTDMEILDEIVGAENWQNEYQRDSKGILQCGIGICVEGEWIWKWSNGVPSDIEKEKGEYSDAFKRAGYMWGIGRCLYNFPVIWVTLNEREYKDDGNRVTINPYRLKPDNWKWEFSGQDVNDGYGRRGVYHRIQATEYYGTKGVVRYDSNPNNAKNQKRHFKSQ